jgi:hypothetical protein
MAYNVEIEVAGKSKYEIGHLIAVKILTTIEKKGLG